MKKEEKTELTRERIIQAAMKEFGEKGYYGSSMNNICGEGIPKGLLYHNFESKDALYLACVQRCFLGLTHCLSAAAIGADLKKYMEVRLNFFRAHKAEARLFFETRLQPPVCLKEQLSKLEEDFDTLNKALYKGILQGLSLREDITEADAMDYFTLLQNMFNGYFSSPAFQAMPLEAVMAAHEDQLSMVLDFMLYGIARRGGDK